MTKAIDPKKPDARVQIKDFSGIAPNADPHDLEPGMATTSVNVMSLRPGEMRVRPGYRAVQFDT